MDLRAVEWRCRRFLQGTAASLVAFQSSMRGLSLLARASPRTPLRVLCIVAFDTLHRMRLGRPLSRDKVHALAALLDLGACANAVLDDKECCQDEMRKTLRLLEESGARLYVADYLQRLNELESNRPVPGDGFHEVVAYREAVVRLSLGMAATIVFDQPCLDDAIRATHSDRQIQLLFRLAMLCQIIDDVLDCAKDRTAGLPSFLTAMQPVEHALALTHKAMLGYAFAPRIARAAQDFPLHLALPLVATCARLVLLLGRWRWAGQDVVDWHETRQRPRSREVLALQNVVHGEGGC